jgi:hypothetical protein
VHVVELDQDLADRHHRFHAARRAQPLQCFRQRARLDTAHGFVGAVHVGVREQIVDPVLDVEIDPVAVERGAGEQVRLARQLAGGADGVVLNTLADGVEHAGREFLRCHDDVSCARWGRVSQHHAGGNPPRERA